ncbi:MAG: twin-arginine translocase TatA/TatE family subunit [Ktedonobacterales bacterium]|nr:twin-arginine translocase TatA/TatE family subunit [Ktedonobacterales bacterium]
MFGIGHFWELLMVVAVALLVFGPKRLPEMGNAVGKTIREFQKSMKDIGNHDNATERQLPPQTTVDATHSETSTH